VLHYDGIPLIPWLLYVCLLGIISLISGIEISCVTTTLGSGIHALPENGLTCTSGSTTIEVTGVATVKVPLANADYTIKGLRFYIPYGISPTPILTFSRQGVAGSYKLKFTDNAFGTSDDSDAVSVPTPHLYLQVATTWIYAVAQLIWSWASSLIQACNGFL
jgi:hypothetical protein